MPLYTYGTYALYDPITDKVVENAVGGKLVLQKDDPGLPLYDLNGNPLGTTVISSNASGQTMQFKAEVMRGLIQFGDVVVTVWSNDVADLITGLDPSNANEALTLAQATADQLAALSVVQNMGGFDRIWGRTAAQGLPTGAEGVLDGDYAALDA